jgi:hypothetical protein
MERSSTSSRKVNPPKEFRKSASIASATHTSSTPQATGPNLANGRHTFIDLPIQYVFADVTPPAARKSKTDAYMTACRSSSPLSFHFHVHVYFMTAWVGAAPTGNCKRAVSTVEHMDQQSKKVKKGLVSLFSSC